MNRPTWHAECAISDPDGWTVAYARKRRPNEPVLAVHIRLRLTKTRTRTRTRTGTTYSTVDQANVLVEILYSQFRANPLVLQGGEDPATAPLHRFRQNRRLRGRQKRAPIIRTDSASPGPNDRRDATVDRRFGYGLMVRSRAAGRRCGAARRSGRMER